MGNLSDAKESLNPKHKPKQCYIVKCGNEAEKWIDISKFDSMALIPLNTYAYETFYLCSNHANKITNENYEYMHLNIKTGEIENIEIAEYSCSPNCTTCNE